MAMAPHMAAMGPIFEALDGPADARLQTCRARDGRRLSEPQAQFDMILFGVMKHLKVLEDAGRVAPRKVGRIEDHVLQRGLSTAGSRGSCGFGRCIPAISGRD